MDDTRFDALTRRLRSRRTVVSGLVGSGLAALLGIIGAGDVTAKKRCGRGKKKCGKQCIPRAQCCKNADCGPGELCVKRTCVVGQGTCNPGADRCDGVEAPSCGAGAFCGCFTTTEGTTRCGAGDISDPCGSTAACARRHPQVPGVFCARLSAPGCLPGTACVGPCPGDG